MLRTWLVPDLPAKIIVGSTMRLDFPVPWSPFTTAFMPPRTAARYSGGTSSGGASTTGSSLSLIIRTRRGTTARPEATRAVIIASCRGEAST